MSKSVVSIGASGHDIGIYSVVTVQRIHVKSTAVGNSSAMDIPLRSDTI